MSALGDAITKNIEKVKKDNEIKNPRTPNQKKQDEKKRREKLAQVRESFKGNPPPKAKPGPENVSEAAEKLTAAKDLEDAALNAATFEGAKNFTDNYYLIQILDQIQELNQDTVYSKWVSLLHGEDSARPAFLKGYFDDWDKFTEMKTEVVSLMVPYFRLSVVTRNRSDARWSDIVSETEVRLQGTYAGSLSPEAALSEQYNEPVVGLKSFNWERTAGTGDAGKKAQTVGKMVLYGNNLSIFTKPPYNLLLGRTAMRDANGNSFGLKVVVGWSLAPGGKDKLEDGGVDGHKFEVALKKARQTIYLFTYRNVFDFNQDGTFQVTLDVVGSTDTFLRDFDLLGLPKNYKEDVEIAQSAVDELDSVEEKNEALKASVEETNTALKDNETPNNDGKRSLEDQMTAASLAIDAAQKDSSRSDEEKEEFKRLRLHLIKRRLQPKYEGDNPEFSTKDDLSTILDEILVSEATKNLKQRTQENMSRMQSLLYKNKKVRYLAVNKQEFAAFSGKTLSAIKGKKEALQVQIESLDQEQKRLEALYGNIDEIVDGTAEPTEEMPGVNAHEFGDIFGFGGDEEQTDAFTLTDPNTGKQVKPSEYLAAKGLVYDVSEWDLENGEDEMREFFDGPYKTQKEELERLEADDYNSREAMELRFALNYAKKMVIGQFYSMEKTAESQRIGAQWAMIASVVMMPLGIAGFVVNEDKPLGKDHPAFQQLAFIKLDEERKLLENRQKIQSQLDEIEKALAPGAPPPDPSLLGISDQDIKEAKDPTVDGPDPSDPETLQNHYISYFFLGDLINVIYEIAHLDEKDNAVPAILLGSMAYEKNQQALGVAYQDGKTPPKRQRAMVAMADIPISIKRFNAFMHKYYVQEIVTRVMLGDFLQKVFDVLVRPIFSGEAFDVKLRNIRSDFLDMDSGEMTMPNHNKMLQIAAGGNGRINLSSIPKTLLYKSEWNEKARAYIMITANLQSQANGRGNYFKDKQYSIPHYYMGADRGILKDVNFSVVQNKFDETDRAIKFSSPYPEKSLQVLKAPYNVNVATIGNPLFTLGSAFYLLPTIPGSGNVEAAKALGLGGYYRVITLNNSITEGGVFETRVFAVNEITAQDSEASPNTTDVSCGPPNSATVTSRVRKGMDCPDGTVQLGTGKINPDPEDEPEENNKP